MDSTFSLPADSGAAEIFDDASGAVPSFLDRLFDQGLLVRTHGGARAFATARAEVPVRLRDGSLPRQVTTAGLALHILKAHPGYVARLHRHGHRVHVYTVDEPEDVAFLLDLGVDGIISNHPRRVLQQLHRA